MHLSMPSIKTDPRRTAFVPDRSQAQQPGF
jgi:hypothetical protein